MSQPGEDIEPLETSLEELLGAEREVPSQPPARREAVYQDVMRRVTLWPPGGDGGPTEGSAPRVNGASSAALLGAGAAIGLVAGLGIGQLVFDARSDSVDPAPSSDGAQLENLEVEPPANRPEPESARVESEPGTVSPTVESPTVEPPALRRPRGPRRDHDVAAPDERVGELDRERAILDVARAAVVRHNPADALSAVTRHQHEFPQGEMAEERESLRVQALVLAGRLDEARLQRDRFLSRFPRSLLRGAVESAVPAEPSH